VIVGVPGGTVGMLGDLVGIELTGEIVGKGTRDLKMFFALLALLDLLVMRIIFKSRVLGRVKNLPLTQAIDDTTTVKMTSILHREAVLSDFTNMLGL
jgi:hypothetical protein